MARLLPGENAKIDRINELVRLVQQGTKEESNEALVGLLDLFHPLILRLCDKWSAYFNDKDHRLKPFQELIVDCQYWFYHYTKEVYDVNGPATYNKFIKDHMDQRVRYIFESEIKYQSRLLFPDPYEDQDGDVLEDVINKYSSGTDDNNPEGDMVDSCGDDARHQLANRLLHLMNSDTFNDRERKIFIEVICNGVTHEQLGEQYNISRTRVTQIFAKVKEKLYKKMEGDALIWQLLDDAGITITNPKLME